MQLGVAPRYFETNFPEAEELFYKSSNLNERGEPMLRIWRTVLTRHLRLDYCDGTQFWLNQEATTIWALWPSTSSLENTTSYLLGPVFGVLLRLRGRVCLHASAITLKDHSIAFIGSEGAGKSTTAAAFVRLGHPGISDDIVALLESEGEFRVVPGYPHLALWPDAANLLYGDSNALPRISPDWEKRRLAMGSDGTCFEGRSLPLGAVYILGSRQSHCAPRVQSMTPLQSLTALVVNSYATNVLDAQMRAYEFEVLGRLVERVPVRLLAPHEDPTQIGNLCELIVNDFETLKFNGTRFS